MVAALIPASPASTMMTCDCGGEGKVGEHKEEDGVGGGSGGINSLPGGAPQSPIDTVPHLCVDPQAGWSWPVPCDAGAIFFAL